MGEGVAPSALCMLQEISGAKFLVIISRAFSSLCCGSVCTRNATHVRTRIGRLVPSYTTIFRHIVVFHFAVSRYSRDIIMQQRAVGA